MTPETFKRDRLSLELTQDRLAYIIGLSVRQVARYEAGTSKVPGPVAKLMQRLTDDNWPAHPDAQKILRTEIAS